MFIQTIIYPSDKDISNTTQSGNAGKHWPQSVSGVVRGERDWREEVFEKHLSGPILQLNTQDSELIYGTSFQGDDGLQRPSWISVCQGMEIKRQEFSKNFWLFQKPACCKYCSLQAVDTSHGKNY